MLLAPRRSMTMTFRWTVTGRAAGLFIIGLLGCSDPYYAACQTEGDCPDGYDCISLGGDEACVPPCATDDDCAIVATHGDAYCTLAGGCVIACEADEDCPNNAECGAGGACVGRSE